jgi:hypothetical protein
MTDTQKNPPLATLDGAFDAFAALPETDGDTGRVLAEAAASLVEVQNEITEELLPEIDEALAAAEALLDDAEVLEKQEEAEGKVDAVRAQLEELDEKPEE